MQLHKIKKIWKKLFVLTSHSELGTQEKKGFWTEEFAAPYYELADKGDHWYRNSKGQPDWSKSEDPSSYRGYKKIWQRHWVKSKIEETHKS
jgi:hypothetical protein